jgi:hypothetical protein
LIQVLGSGLAKKRLQAFKQSKVKFTLQHETVHNNFEIVGASRALHVQTRGHNKA